MNTDCGVARDLMPLCLDGAASAQSAELVRGHVEECEACRAYYEKMKAQALPADAGGAAREQTEFGQLAQLMRKMRRWRAWRNVIIGVLAGILAVVGMYAGWQWLAVGYNAQWPADQYALSLARLKDGRVIVSADYQGSKRDVGLIIRSVFPSLTGGQGLLAGGTTGSGLGLENGGVLHLWYETTIIPRNMQQENRNGPVHIIGDIEEVDAVYAGQNGERAVWRRGDPIPEASGEMEAYYQAERELAQYWGEAYMMELSDGNSRLRTQEGEGDSILNTLLHKLETLRSEVPEWK